MTNQRLSDREQQALEILMEEGAVAVADFSRRLSISQSTARLLLNGLADKGLLVRSHGKATASFHPDILRRQRDRIDEKAAIGKAAAALIGDGDTIFIEAGTTTAAIGRFLLGKGDLQIVSNSTLLLPGVRTNPRVHLHMLGGQFVATTESLVGPRTVEEIDRFFFGTAFVGTDGFSNIYGLTTHLVAGAEVVRSAAARAERLVLLADSSKWGRRGFVAVLPFERVDIVITDREIGDEALEAMKGAGVEVLLV